MQGVLDNRSTWNSFTFQFLVRLYMKTFNGEGSEKEYIYIPISG